MKLPRWTPRLAPQAGRLTMADSETTVSPLRALYGSYPGAFLLIDTVMHRAQPEWRSVLERASVTDPSRLDGIVRREVALADRRLATSLAQPVEQRFHARHEF